MKKTYIHKIHQFLLLQLTSSYWVMYIVKNLVTQFINSLY